MIDVSDLRAQLAAFEAIPGTRVFTAARARRGYHLNQFAMSLKESVNRASFKANERAYLDGWPLTEAQREGVLRRDYNALLDEGGNIFFLSKLFSTDGISTLQAVGSMTGMTPEEYQAMMVAGGRSLASAASEPGQVPHAVSAAAPDPADPH